MVASKFGSNESDVSSMLLVAMSAIPDMVSREIYAVNDFLHMKIDIDEICSTDTSQRNARVTISSISNMKKDRNIYVVAHA